MFGTKREDVIREWRKLHSRELHDIYSLPVIRFGPKKEDVMREWRKLLSKKLHDIYSLPVIRVIKSERMRWARHVACKGETGMHEGFRIKS